MISKSFPHYPHKKVWKLGIIQGKIKERMFCGVMIKIVFCRKKSANVLTFKKSNFNGKLS